MMDFPALPRPLCGLDEGTFTEYTVIERFPATVRRVLDENELSSLGRSKNKDLAQ